MTYDHLNRVSAEYHTLIGHTPHIFWVFIMIKAEALSDCMSDRNIAGCVASALLRDAMVATDSAISYKKVNPEATASQTSLYGNDFAESETPWLQRICGEANSNGFQRY